jgi:hypothetical protein
MGRWAGCHRWRAHAVLTGHSHGDMVITGVMDERDPPAGMAAI